MALSVFKHTVTFLPVLPVRFALVLRGRFFGHLGADCGSYILLAGSLCHDLGAKRVGVVPPPPPSPTRPLW